MKVLQFGKFFPPDTGGMESVIGDLTNGLSKEIACDVLCCNSKNKTEIDNSHNYQIIRTASLIKLFSTSISPALVYWLKKIGNNYDIIHLHLPDPMASLAYFLVRPKGGLVLHWHSDIIRQKIFLFLYDPLQFWILKKSDKIIATSSRYAQGSRYLKKYQHKTVVIPLGLDVEKFKKSEFAIKEIKNKFKNKPIVFSLGRLIYYKGYEFLIEAMKSVEAYLLIGGSGSLERKLQKQIEDCNMGKKVFLLGKIKNEDLGSYYQVCDVFCLPSIYKSEAFGLVQSEAMFFGKPVVSTDIIGSGTAWVNQDGETGFTVPPRDSDALAAAINKIINNPKIKLKMGVNSKRRFEDNFTIDIMVEKTIKLYKELIK